jgi:hypothetical protein
MNKVYAFPLDFEQIAFIYRYSGDIVNNTALLQMTSDSKNRAGRFNWNNWEHFDEEYHQCEHRAEIKNIV